MRLRSLLVTGLALCTTACASPSALVVPTPWGVAGVTNFREAAPAPRSEVALRIEAQRGEGLVSQAAPVDARQPATAVVAAR